MVEGKLRLWFAAFRFAAREEKFDGLVALALAVEVRIEVKIGVALALTFDLSKLKVAKVKV